VNTPLQVLIVDDHQMFREGVRNRLEQEPDIQVVGEAGSAQEAFALVEQTNPFVVTLDIRLPDASGIKVARLLRQQHPELRILILSAYDFDQYVEAAIRLGVDGYLLKGSSQEKLVQALREIATGGVVLPPSIAAKLMRTYSTPRIVFRNQKTAAGELTVRELEVVELMAHRLKNREIAQQLLISVRTVEAHVSNIMAKLGAQSRMEAVQIAIEENLLSLEERAKQDRPERCRHG
jgi:two-component system response regulator DevR